MSSDQSTALQAARREPAGSRSARRLRREGAVLGVVYGGGQDPVSFQVNSRELRNTLAHAGAVIDLQLDGEKTTTPVVLKELVRHPVTGDTTHVDLLRVDLLKPIQTQVTLELVGTDAAPGVVQGGVLEHTVREVTVEALPNEIPEVVQLDISNVEMGGSISVGDIQAAAGITIISEADTVVATIHAPRLRDSGEAGEETEIEMETEVVGEAAAAESGSDAGSE